MCNPPASDEGIRAARAGTKHTPKRDLPPLAKILTTQCPSTRTHTHTHTHSLAHSLTHMRDLPPLAKILKTQCPSTFAMQSHGRECS